MVFQNLEYFVKKHRNFLINLHKEEPCYWQGEDLASSQQL